MKPVFCSVLMMLFIHVLYAQKGNDQLQFIAEAGIPGKEQKIGPGMYVKGAFGAGSAAQITLMAGWAAFRSKAGGHLQTATRMISVLAGYKKSIKRFYIEPQAGYGELGGKIDLNGDVARPSVGAFIWAVGSGYTFGRMHAGIRFQKAYAAEGNAAGIWRNKTLHFTGLQLGYAILK